MDSNKLLGYTLLLYLILLFFQHNNKDLKKQDVIPEPSQSHWYDVNLKVNDNVKKNQEYVLENDELKIYFSTLGGGIKTVELKNYEKFSGGPVTLVNNHSSILNCQICTGEQCLDTYDKNFDVITYDNKIVFEYSYGQDEKITQTYSFDPHNKFAIQYSLDISNISNKETTLFLDNLLLQQEKNFKDCQLDSNISFCNKEGKVSTLVAHPQQPVEKDNINLKWIALKQKFFTTGLFITNDNDSKVYSYKKADSVLQHSKISFKITSKNNIVMKYYFGPNVFKNLKPFADKFENTIYYGVPVVRIVNKYLILPAIDFLSKKGFVAILILLLITLFLKILLFPFSLHMQRVGERLKIINPLLQRLNEKYKDDQQRLIFEQAKLYRQYNVNPFSPLLGSFIQIPLIIAMFNAIPISMAFRGQKFLWCSDLSSYDSIIDFKFSIPFYGDHISLMSLLAVVVTTLFLFYEGRTMNTSKNSKIFIIMSILMMTWFSNNFCAALNIYYIMLGVFSFLNSYVVRKLTSSQNIEKNND